MADFQTTLQESSIRTLGSQSNASVYVDATNGNDANAGSADAPIKSLWEASKRVAHFEVGDIILEDGNHALTDLVTLYGSATKERHIFKCLKELTIRGRNTSVVQAITITGWADNVATVSETLEANAHVGEFIEQVLFGSFTFRWFVLANTANTITFAVTTTAMGGFLTPQTGTYNLSDFSAKIVYPNTNASQIVNRFNFEGKLTLENLLVDGSVNGGFVGLTSYSMAGNLRLLRSKVKGFTTAIEAFGSTTLTQSYLDGKGTASTKGLECSAGRHEMSGDNVFKDLAVAVRVGSNGYCNFASQQTVWAPGCGLVCELDSGEFYDFTANLYQEAGPFSSENYLRFDGPSIYRKQNLPLNQIGDNELGYVFTCTSGGVSADLVDSADAVLNGTPDYVVVDGSGASLAEYNAGDAPATGVREYSVPGRNVAFFD